ncbi:transporter [Mycolicibacterium duvalii]|nr:sulfite exporter TauE/SafE family protein [Mycolicibacterium duvalii]MCV7369878.1 sulfite exporter TauE/SafE family protein [Mycolicibacterium duvalii]PEG35779.1 transporter [Mycolicibacterium duvalii]
MSWSQALLLVGAGILGGLTGSIAGLASVATYPALLLFGLPPVTANVTNTTALVFNAVGSIAGSRPELARQTADVKRLIPAALAGGAVGAILLLSTPAEGFERIVPVLLGFASAAILVPVRVHPARVTSPRRRRVTTLLQGAAIMAICIYGGYFGAAAGVLLLALLLRAGRTHLADANATKNVVLGIANTVAAGIFAVAAPVRWDAAIVLGLGCLVGSRLGPVVVRHAPQRSLRIAIGLAGLALTLQLGWDAYR